MHALTIKESPGRGRGVFAARAFNPGDIIEVCPVIVLSPEDAHRLDPTALYSYYFGWSPDNTGGAIALGYGSLYNHSDTPNAAYHRDEAARAITITALRPIAAEEEILITYNFGSTGAKPWFEAR
jgi:SET domain-containing protein